MYRMLSRRLLLSAVPVTSAVAMEPARAQSSVRSDAQRIESYLNGVSTLKARFLQLAQNGDAAQGTAWIWRPGRMRFEYDPPESLLLIASDGQFMHLDRELGQPSIVPVSSTPLGFLLRANLRLSGDITVTDQERTGGFLRVTLHRTGAPAEGRLTLVFAEEPMELRQWVLTDAQARRTRVTLTNIEKGVRFDPLLFTFNDPRFNDSEQNRR